MERVMYSESNRSSRDGMIAVGSVVMNRVQSEAYPDTICGVVTQSGQFAPACHVARDARPINAARSRGGRLGPARGATPPDRRRAVLPRRRIPCVLQQHALRPRSRWQRLLREAQARTGDTADTPYAARGPHRSVSIYSMSRNIPDRTMAKEGGERTDGAASAAFGNSGPSPKAKDVIHWVQNWGTRDERH